MPNCFQLTRKSAPEAGPISLVKIDQEMCEHFKVPCDPKLWYHYWYDIIGFSLACGKSFGDLRAHYAAAQEGEPNQTQKIIDWLDEHFTTDAWATIGK